MTTPKVKKSVKKPAAPNKRSGAGARVNGLLPKQAKFVAEYLISGNATQAAIHAGYSPKTAHVIGLENLKKPVIASLLSEKQVIIAKRQDERLEAMELTKERVAREIARIPFFDPRKMFHPDGRPKEITELDDDTAAAIVGIDVLEEWDGSGESRVLRGYVKKYKVANKNVAHDQASKILGMYEKDNTQKTDPLTELLQKIATGNNSAFKPVVDDPEREDRP